MRERKECFKRRRELKSTDGGKKYKDSGKNEFFKRRQELKGANGVKRIEDTVKKEGCKQRLHQEERRLQEKYDNRRNCADKES